MNKNKFVNGPVNTVRLEGSIGNIKKTIYLFMDFHAQVEIQTECDDIRSKDIDKFLIDTFDQAEEMKKNIMYDFFVETNPLYPLKLGVNPHKGQYLRDQIGKLVETTLNFESGKVYQSEILKNVRLHFTDIRDYTTLNNEHIYNEIGRILNLISHDHTIFYGDLPPILDGLKIIYSNITYLYQLIYKTKNMSNPQTKIIFTKDQEILANYSKEDFDEIAKKFIYKIIRSYTHADVHQIINTYISNELHGYFEKFFKEADKIIIEINNLLKILEPYKDKPYNITLIKQKDSTYMYSFNQTDMNEYVYNINKINQFLYDSLIVEIGLNLMDLYLLRRILDKDYVHNAVVYTGAHHSLNYIRILVKYFDFKITNYSYLKNNDLKKAEKIIIKSKNIDELGELFYPPELKQCSNLSEFPELLT